MSILLEALRKSEKNQHSRDVPTIYADDHSGPVSEPIKSGPLALLLVAALFISGWFVWRQYQPPVAGVKAPVVSAELPVVGTQEPAVSLQTPVTGTRTSPVSAGQPAVDTRPADATDSGPVTREVDHVSALTDPLAGDESGQQMSSSSTVADKSARQQRTPMESYQLPDPAVANSKTVGAKPLSGTRTPAITKDDSTVKPVEPATDKSSPAEPAPISYWELPDAVRADLPEIKFSVLVYANKPADRFVLINGERLTEGDSPQPGLTVKEIRREGVVFSYRLYQFLIER